jgi:hypothetical protein
MAFKKGEGGRPKGSKNKLTLARLQLRQEALRRLNEDLPEDAFRGDAIELFQRVYRDPNFDPQLRLDAAAKIAAFERKESGTETAPRYVAIMPIPVKDLDEWRQRYMDVAPNTDPAEMEWLERVAKAGLEVQKGASAKDNPLWLDDKEARNE